VERGKGVGSTSLEHPSPGDLDMASHEGLDLDHSLNSHEVDVKMFNGKYSEDRPIALFLHRLTLVEPVSSTSGLHAMNMGPRVQLQR
jgi:hypothetical protein